MTAVIAVALSLLAAGGLAVVLTDDPRRQAPMLSVYGLLLAVLFLSVQAPDVALSQVGVGAAIVPLLVMLCIRRVERRR